MGCCKANEGVEGMPPTNLQRNSVSKVTEPLDHPKIIQSLYRSCGQAGSRATARSPSPVV